MTSNTNILKNPIILGVIATLISYGYLYIKNNNKKNKKKIKKKQNINIIPPITIGLVIGFLSYNYLENDSEINNIKNNNIQVIEGGSKINPMRNTSLNFSSEKSYKLIGTNKLDTLNPDVFIDLADF